MSAHDGSCPSIYRSGTADLSHFAAFRIGSTTVNECQLPTTALRALNVAFGGGNRPAAVRLRGHRF